MKPALVIRAVVVPVGLGLALARGAWAQTPWTAPESRPARQG